MPPERLLPLLATSRLIWRYSTHFFQLWSVLLKFDDAGLQGSTKPSGPGGGAGGSKWTDAEIDALHKAVNNFANELKGGRPYLTPVGSLFPRNFF